MDKNQSLYNLLSGTATEEDIELLKRLLASGEISIGGNVNQSVIIIGSGNTVELPPAALDRLNARPMLGNLDRDLTGEEIASGLRRLDKLLPNRAPVLLPHYKEQVGRLRPTLKIEVKALSETSRRERLEALAAINSICVEALDVSFNGLSLGEEAPKYDARSPFRGLESFRPEDSEFFFGREALTRKLVAQIQAHPFLAVLGASGSGKSSLVMAGVIPALGLDYAIIRPGENPLEALESAKGKALLVVDQFEELFTLTKNEDKQIRADFISAVLDLARSSKVIITLRSDFLSEVGAYRSLSKEIQNHLETILPMGTDSLRHAMEGQARLTNLEFEADLSQQILEDVDGEPGAMPLLQHALWELWNRRHGRHLRASEYRAFGGVKQAIASTAEQVYGECSKVEQEQLREIFLRLTSLDKNDEGRDTRRRVSLSGLAFSKYNDESTNLLLDKLANARLIVKSVNGDKTEVEVVHEALIRHWERLRIWLNEDRDALRLRESVSESATEWERSGRHESLLNSRWVKLDEALLLVQDSRYQLTEIEQAYLKGCVALRDREQRELERRLRYTMFASIAAAVIFLVLGGFGWIKSNEATARANDSVIAQAKEEEQAKIALARQLAAQAHLINLDRSSNQMTATLLAIQSMKLFPNRDAARYFLNNNSSAIPLSRMRHDARVISVTFSPDGKYVVSGSGDGTARVWDAATGKEVARMTHDTQVTSVAFSPDGKYVVSGSGDGTARVWETTTGIEVARATHDSWVTSVAFSPDGKYVVSGNGDGTARVWDAATGKEVARMTHDTQVTSVAFSPDGKYVVSGSSDGTARVWDAATGEEAARMTHDTQVTSVAFSPDGKYVVSGSDDGTARVWETTTGIEVARATHDSWVTSVTFSPNGKYVVSGGFDDDVQVWEVASAKEVARMTHDGGVTSVAFSPDGKFIVSGDTDGIANVTETSTGNEVTRIHHDGVVVAVAVSPNSKYALTGSYDGTARVWEIATGKEVAYMQHGSTVTSVAFSPDGNFVVSASMDGTARIWETATGKEVARMTSDNGVDTVAFSPNGKYVASGSGDGVARIWEAVTGKEVARITHDNLVNLVAFSPDGNYVVSLGSLDNTARVWEVTTGKEIIRITSLDIMMISSVFSPDGKYMVSGSGGGTAQVWEVATGKEISRMVHDGSVTSIAFSADGKYVVSGSGDGTARVWETTTGKEVARMIHDGGVTSVVFSPDGRYVVSGSRDGTVRGWIWRPQDLIETACEVMPRNLTRAEWSQYIGDALPYQAVCPNLPIEPEPTATP